MEIARRAVHIYSNFFTTAVCTDWRPDFADVTGQHTDLEVEAIARSHLDRDLEMLDVVRDLRSELNRQEDKANWERFSYALGCVFDNDLSVFFSKRAMGARVERKLQEMLESDEDYDSGAEGGGYDYGEFDW